MNLFSMSPAAITRNPQFADVTLVDSISGKTVAAHRFVLAQRSEFFRSLFSNGMRESVESVIQLEDIKFGAFEVLLDFMYSQSPDCAEGLCASDLMDLLAIADRFLVNDLVEICEFYLQDKVTRDTLMTIVDFAMRSVPSDSRLSSQSCGPSGMGLLRSCQSFLIANLGSLASDTDMEDPRVVSLLASTHMALLSPIKPHCHAVGSVM